MGRVNYFKDNTFCNSVNLVIAQNSGGQSREHPDKSIWSIASLLTLQVACNRLLFYTSQPEMSHIAKYGLAIKTDEKKGTTRQYQPKVQTYLFEIKRTTYSYWDRCFYFFDIAEFHLFKCFKPHSLKFIMVSNGFSLKYVFFISKASKTLSLLYIIGQELLKFPRVL